MVAGWDDRGVRRRSHRSGRAAARRNPGLYHAWAWFLPDGSGLLLYGTQAAENPRFGVHRFEGGEMRMITRERVLGNAVAFSPDGRFVAVARQDGSLAAYPLHDGEVRPLPRLTPGETPIQWSADGRRLYVTRLGLAQAAVYLVDCESGARTLWRTLSPADPAGAGILNDVFLTRDGSAYAYHFGRDLDELQVVDGLV